jgi:hydrogenase expression/formation protein HypE
MLNESPTQIVLDHGTGGLLSYELITKVIIPNLGEAYIGELEDSSVVKSDFMGQIAITTDSFVVDPIFFVNGDIGKISICGTVNDIAVSGATPLYLTLGMIIEEGFPIKDLIKILSSIRHTALEANVKIVAGDTKIVRKGEADKIFINTAGVGFFSKHSPIHVRGIIENDNLIVTSDLGNHSVHLLSLREGLGFENKILSDCAPLNKLIDIVLSEFGKDIHYIHDLTRGGLGAALNEVVYAINRDITISEIDIPVQFETKMAADMLGVSPLYLANEGALCIFCDPKITNSLLDSLKKLQYGKNSCLIGKVNTEHEKTHRVYIKTGRGTKKILQNLYGMELPRLC